MMMMMMMNMMMIMMMMIGVVVVVGVVAVMLMMTTTTTMMPISIKHVSNTFSFFSLPAPARHGNLTSPLQSKPALRRMAKRNR